MSASKKGAVAGSAVIACCVAFTPTWEGMDSVAVVDRIGTGHPVTYCYGQTSEFGDVKAGQHFTKVECDKKLAASLPKYQFASLVNEIEPPQRAKSLLLATPG